MTYKKWGIYRANLDPVIGSEQGKSRPVIIVSENQINELLNVVNIIPITSLKPGRRIYPNEALLETDLSGLPNDSIALCDQIRTIDKRRLSTQLGDVTNTEKQGEITGALCFQLGIDIN